MGKHPFFNSSLAKAKMEKEKEKAIVLYPAPGIGHIASIVELANNLTSQFSLHLLLPTPTDPAVDSFLLRHTTLSLHRLPPPSLSLSTPSVSPAAVAFESIRLRTNTVRDFLCRIGERFDVKALVLDFFCASAFEVAVELGIPVYCFFTSGAAALALYLYFPVIDREISGSFKDLVSNQIRNIPGLPTLRAIHMPEPVLDRNDPAYNDILNCSLHLPKANGIIVNTFESLEPIPIRAIANGSCTPNASTPPLYYIGPIISQHNNSETKHECLTWLDQHPSKSVIFLCFGSRGSFSIDQVTEIAQALEKSEHRFLWVVKSPPLDKMSKQIKQVDDHFDVGSILPSGFQDKTKGRGMVVASWAPQPDILAHASVGGFVTHCGWNSVLEAVTAAVPMIAWPLYAEQYVNRAALVEDMKMAIAVEQREGDGFVREGELERRVRELMGAESGRELRERSMRCREEALAAWGESGSSTVALGDLIHAWS